VGTDADDAEHTLATVWPMFSRVDEELLFDDLPGAGRCWAEQQEYLLDTNFAYCHIPV